jgi:hypothetical protein
MRHDAEYGISHHSERLAAYKKCSPAAADLWDQ